MLREPCEHGQYEGHRPNGDDEFCPGGRSLTDGEALNLLLTDVCERCDGTGHKDSSCATPQRGFRGQSTEDFEASLRGRRETTDPSGLLGMLGWRADTASALVANDPCPSCGGSGRTPKEGVEMDMRWPGSGDWVMFPASMLEGGDPE